MEAEYNPPPLWELIEEAYDEEQVEHRIKELEQKKKRRAELKTAKSITDSKAYYQANKEDKKKYRDKYYQANKERLLRKQKEYYEANPEAAKQKKAYLKEWYKKNKKRIRKKVREYRRQHRELCNQQQSKYWKKRWRTDPEWREQQLFKNKLSKTRNRDEKLARRRAHYQANKEQINKQKRERYAANKDKLNARRRRKRRPKEVIEKEKRWQAAWREAHRKEARAYAKAYYHKNRERILAENKEKRKNG